MELSEEEKKLLSQYQILSSSIPNFANRIAVEIVPPIIFVGLGLYTGQILWFLILIAMLVFYNLQRVIRQYKNIVRLKSISEKTLGTLEEQIAEVRTTGKYRFDEMKKCFWGDAKVVIGISKISNAKYQSTYYEFDGNRINLEDEDSVLFEGDETTVIPSVIKSFNDKPELFMTFPIYYTNVTCKINS